MPYERIIEIRIIDGILVRLSHSGRPIERYSVVLMAVIDGVWETIRIYDNHLGTHHMHRYTRKGGKQPGTLFTKAQRMRQSRPQSPILRRIGKR